ncbi:MAG TPA: hypothetical protein VIS52_09290 [Motiliproteus sp.]
MSLIFGQQQLRHTSRVNILVVLLMLFLISGHCSSAMAQAQLPLPLAVVDSGEHAEHCGGKAAQTFADDAEYCWDDHCPDDLTPLQSSKQGKLDQPSADLLAAPVSALPFARAGPCEPSLDYDPPIASPTPLYYALCVLRL